MPDSYSIFHDGRPARLSPALRARLRRIAHVALDMDGTIYKGSTLFACTRPFLERLERLGLGYTFLTNNPSKSAEDYRRHLRELGLNPGPDQLYTSAHATLAYLRRQWPDVRRVFVLGTASLQAEFAAAGFTLTGEDHRDVPDAVVVGFDTELTYARLCRAAWWIQQGKPYLATNPDAVCPTDAPTVLVDCGALCAALARATGRVPDAVLGKPDPAMLAGLPQTQGLAAAEVAVVGDRIYTDLLMAQRAQAFGVLVLTGEATPAMVARTEPPPDLVVPSLAEFGELLYVARQPMEPS